MGARFGLRAGGFTAAIACAFLVACGGGGGGGGVTPTTPAPIVTPTPFPTSQSASGAASTSAVTSLTFGGISNGTIDLVSSAIFKVPAVSGASNASGVMQASLPAGAPNAPQLHTIKSRARQATSLCVSTCTIVPVAYITLTMSATVSVATSPEVVMTLPSAVADHYYLVVYAQGQWNQISDVASKTTTVDLPPVAQTPPFTLTANTPYVFAVVYTSAGAIGTPTPPPPVATTSPTSAPTASIAAGAASPLPTATVAGAWSPSDVANAFHYPVQNGWDGTGETIAIIGIETPAPTDLQTYQTRFSLPHNPYSRYTTVTVTGATPQPYDAGSRDEATLDAETVMGLAPGATFKFYTTNGDGSNQAFLAAEQQIATDNPDVLSYSFGGCENYPTVAAPAPAPPDAPIFASMLAAGTAVTVSAGDEGDNCSYSASGTTFGLDYPGSDPSVISVGGTETDSGQGYTLLSPQTWNDSVFSSGQGAGGGGVSTVFNIPAWQQGIPGMPNYTYRNTPDIAYPAEGVYLDDAGPAVFGGTSWSAPQAAALMAELDEYCNGRPSNPVAELYNGWINNTNNYLDVTTGDNHWIATDGSRATYSARVGYDNNGGVGEAYGSAVAATLCTGSSRTWTMSRRVNMFVQRQQPELYGQQRDTQLVFAKRFTDAEDLGSRGANESTHAMIVLRRTTTMGSDAHTVIAELQKAGMNVTWSSGALISFQAPSSTIGNYFRTSLHQISQGKYGMRYSNVGPITVPAAIAPYVSTVLADSLIARKPLHHRMR